MLTTTILVSIFLICFIAGVVVGSSGG